jgi:hypothetical protein
MPKQIYVMCRVSKGFWENELYVSVGGTSAFVQRENVRVDDPPEPNKEVVGKVLAFLLHESGDKALIELPGEPVVGGLRNWVPMAALAKA